MTDDTTTTEAQPELDAPKDVDSKVSTGTGVYNVTLQRFVGGVFRGSDAAKDAKAYIDSRKDDGHTYVTRKV